MIFLLIIIALLTFFVMCELAAIAARLDRIIDNQDIIKCIKKNNK